MIAKALNAKVIAIDIMDDALSMARACGADHTINSNQVSKVPMAIKDIHERGVQVSIDALGNTKIIRNSIESLAKRGKHIQIGLLEQGSTNVDIPMEKIIANELKIIGSHGMQAHRYPQIFKMWNEGLIDPGMMITDVVNLEDGINILTEMENNPPKGVAIINDFS